MKYVRSTKTIKNITLPRRNNMVGNYLFDRIVEIESAIKRWCVQNNKSLVFYIFQVF